MSVLDFPGMRFFAVITHIYEGDVVVGESDTYATAGLFAAEMAELMNERGGGSSTWTWRVDQEVAG